MRPTESTSATLSFAPLPAGKRMVIDPAVLRSGVAIGFLPSNTRTLLRVDRRMRYGEFIWNDTGVPAGDIQVAVDLRTQVLSVFRAGHEIGTALVLYGAHSHETPTGRFPIRGKERLHHSRAYVADMPYTMWLTRDGVALHASNVRWGAATHGCLGLPESFAAKLFAITKVGTPVTIIRSPEERDRATAS